MKRDNRQDQWKSNCEQWKSFIRVRKQTNIDCLSWFEENVCQINKQWSRENKYTRNDRSCSHQLVIQTNISIRARLVWCSSRELVKIRTIIVDFPRRRATELYNLRRRRRRRGLRRQNDLLKNHCVDVFVDESSHSMLTRTLFVSSMSVDSAATVRFLSRRRHSSSLQWDRSCPFVVVRVAVEARIRWRAALGLVRFSLDDGVDPMSRPEESADAHDVEGQSDLNVRAIRVWNCPFPLRRDSLIQYSRRFDLFPRSFPVQRRVSDRQCDDRFGSERNDRWRSERWRTSTIYFVDPTFAVANRLPSFFETAGSSAARGRFLINGRPTIGSVVRHHCCRGERMHRSIVIGMTGLE